MISFTIPFVAVFQRPRPRPLRNGGGYWNPHEKQKRDIACLALVGRQEARSSILRGDVAVYVTCYGFGGKDLDNAVKLILDAMNQVIYEDDDQVCLIVARKLRVGDPRMEVEVTKLD